MLFGLVIFQIKLFLDRAEDILFLSKVRPLCCKVTYRECNVNSKSQGSGCLNTLVLLDLTHQNHVSSFYNNASVCHDAVS